MGPSAMARLWLGAILVVFGIEASTHWKRFDKQIISHRISPLVLVRPYSLVELMDQEEDIHKLIASSAELAELNKSMKQREARDDPNVEQRLLYHDEDCKQVPNKEAILALQTTFFETEYSPVQVADFVYFVDLEAQAFPPWTTDDSLRGTDNAERGPDCSHYYPIDYSPYVMEHLSAFANRHQLRMRPTSPAWLESMDKFMRNHIMWKRGVKTEFPLMKDITVALQSELTQKSPARNMVTLHILSTMYWMGAGDAPQAMECARTALYLAHNHNLRHHSNIDWRGVVFLLVGNLLSFTHQYEDAAVLLELSRVRAHSKSQFILATSALADVHAQSANFTEAIRLYGEADNNEIKDAEVAFHTDNNRRKRAALECNTKIQKELRSQHDNLQAYLREGQQYNSDGEKHSHLANVVKSRRAEKGVVDEDLLIFENAVYGYNPHRECRMANVEHPKTKEVLRKNAINCKVHNRAAYESSMTRTRAAHVRPSTHNNSAWKTTPIFTRDRSYARKLEGMKREAVVPEIQEKYPLSSSLLHDVTYQWRLADWPSAGSCDELLFYPDMSKVDHLPQIFMSPEEKGYIVSDLLTKEIGLDMEAEHPLPWEEPHCEDEFNIEDTVANELMGINKSLHTPQADHYAEKELKGVLIRLAERKMNEAEVGQRIKTMMKNDVGPKWISRNLAALYFRVVGWPAAATKCLLSALTTKEHMDVAYIQLGQLSYRVNHRKPESELMYHLAAQASNKQPQPFYLTARLHILTNAVDKAVARFKDSLDRDPFQEEALHELMSIVCKGQPSKPTVRHLHPTICCSEFVQNAVCFKLPTGDFCYVLESDMREGGGYEDRGGWRLGGEERLVYNRCNRQYTGQVSYPIAPIIRLLSPFLPIFHMAGRRRDNFLLEEPEGVQIIQTPEIPLDYGGTGGYFGHRSPDWYTQTQTRLTYAVHEEEKDQIDLEIDYQQPIIPHKPLSLLWISHKSEMLKYDVPLPEYLPKPSRSLVRAGLTKFPPPKVSPGQCSGVKPLAALLDNQISTWLSVSAKGADVEKYIDVHSVMPRNLQQLSPECPAPKKFAPFRTLDHLPYFALSDQFLFYKPEKALADALLAIGRKETIEGMGARLGQAIRIAMHGGDESEAWLPAVVSALYWRVRGDSQKAVACLRLTLAHAPQEMRDVALVSLANVCHQAGLLHSALIAAGAALDVSSSLVATHFTIANIYASIGDYGRALEFYYSSIALQSSSFDHARQRIRAIYCYHEGEKYNLHHLV